MSLRTLRSFAEWPLRLAATVKTSWLVTAQPASSNLRTAFLVSGVTSIAEETWVCTTHWSVPTSPAFTLKSASTWASWVVTRCGRYTGILVPRRTRLIGAYCSSRLRALLSSIFCFAMTSTASKMVFKDETELINASPPVMRMSHRYGSFLKYSMFSSSWSFQLLLGRSFSSSKLKRPAWKSYIRWQ